MTGKVPYSPARLRLKTIVRSKPDEIAAMQQIVGPA